MIRKIPEVNFKSAGATDQSAPAARTRKGKLRFHVFRVERFEFPKREEIHRRVTIR